MSAVTRCHAHREPRPACVPVRRPDDALAVILTAAASPARPETICVLLDHAHRGLGVIVVEGAMSDDGIFEIAEVVIRAADGRGTIGAVVLASIGVWQWTPGARLIDAGVLVTSASTDDPRGTVMVYSNPEQDVAVVWVLIRLCRGDPPAIANISPR